MNQEIAVLLCELRPMRKRVTELEQIIFYDRGSILPFSEPLTTDGASTSAMVEIMMRQTELAGRLSQVRSYVGPAASRVLQNEVNEGAKVCEQFSKALSDLKAETDEIVNEIETFRKSTLFRDSQSQKDRIVELSEAYTIERRKHEDLREEIYQLTDDVASRESQHVHEAEVTQKLTRRLDELRRKQFERLEAYAKLRESQVHDVMAVKECLDKSVGNDQESGETFEMLTNLEGNDQSGSIEKETESIPQHLISTLFGKGEKNEQQTEGFSTALSGTSSLVSTVKSESGLE
jgi:predicted  nucleic acid-binding Zn-ribbon protein